MKKWVYTVIGLHIRCQKNIFLGLHRQFLACHGKIIVLVSILVRTFSKKRGLSSCQVDNTAELIYSVSYYLWWFHWKYAFLAQIGIFFATFCATPLVFFALFESRWECQLVCQVLYLYCFSFCFSPVEHRTKLLQIVFFGIFKFFFK